MVAGVSNKELEIIKNILAPYAIKYEFYFYGSRVKGTFGKTSDLDVLIKGKEVMPLVDLEVLKERFDESFLPYIVNFSDYHKMDEKFFALIKYDLVKIF